VSRGTWLLIILLDVIGLSFLWVPLLDHFVHFGYCGDASGC